MRRPVEQTLVHDGADRATCFQTVLVMSALTAPQRFVEIRLVPCRRGLRVGARPPRRRRHPTLHADTLLRRDALHCALCLYHHLPLLPAPATIHLIAAPPFANAGPGRGVVLLRTRGPQTRVGVFQQSATAHGLHDPTLLKSTCGFSPVEFDAIVELACERVERTMDPRLHRSVEMNDLRNPRRLVCSAVEMILLTLVLLHGGEEGALPLRTVSFNIGVSLATVSNCHLHCVLALHDTFMHACPIVWPSAAERREMEGLVNAFPSVSSLSMVRTFVGGARRTPRSNSKTMMGTIIFIALSCWSGWMCMAWLCELTCPPLAPVQPNRVPPVSWVSL